MMENWNVANLTEEQLTIVKDVEKSLGVSLVAYATEANHEEHSKGNKMEEN
ncbi:hypothetical protein QUF56_12810 [Ureibacillus composti]|nr:hypothetical protein [Ureibacillus composti]